MNGIVRALLGLTVLVGAVPAVMAVIDEGRVQVGAHPPPAPVVAAAATGDTGNEPSSSPTSSTQDSNGPEDVPLLDPETLTTEHGTSTTHSHASEHQKSSTSSTSQSSASTTATSQAVTSTSGAQPSVAPDGRISLSSDWVITGHDERADFRVDGNGHQIMIDGGSVDWSSFTIDNVSRVMFMNCAKASTLRSGLVSNSGKFELGFYPLHWHLNGDCTRGTVVDQVTIRNSRFRGFVPHGSHGITIKNSSCDKVRGQCLWWDPPCSTDGCSRLDRASNTKDNSNDILVDNLTASGSYWDRSGPCCEVFHSLTAIELGAGSGNSIRNSTVSNVSGGSECSGYFWPGSANNNRGGNVWRFVNNRVSNIGNCHGIRVWQNDSNPHVITSFTGNRVSHGAYLNNYRYEDIHVDLFILHALGRTGEPIIINGGSIETVVVKRHRLAGEPVYFQNMTIGSVTIDNRAPDENPGTYHFVDTGLDCNDVEYVSVVPGTRVVIDGVDCKE